MYSCNVYNTFNSFDGDNNAGFENEAIEAQIRFETMQDQKRKNSTKKHKKQQWERRQRRSRRSQRLPPLSLLRGGGLTHQALRRIPEAAAALPPRSR